MKMMQKPKRQTNPPKGKAMTAGKRKSGLPAYSQRKK